ncbi:Protein of unknown function [Gryllus bimaculatus]|nr:Protein of unknown function [Gryllus bimaculatus]
MHTHGPPGQSPGAPHVQGPYDDTTVLGGVGKGLGWAGRLRTRRGQVHSNLIRRVPGTGTVVAGRRKLQPVFAPSGNTRGNQLIAVPDATARDLSFLFPVLSPPLTDAHTYMHYILGLVQEISGWGKLH